MKKINRKSVGKFVRVSFDCIGARDGIVVHVDDSGKTFRFLPLYPEGNDSAIVDTDQIISIGDYVSGKGTGI